MAKSRGNHVIARGPREGASNACGATRRTGNYNLLTSDGRKTCRTNVIRPPDDAMTMNECIGRLSGRRDAQGLTMYAGCRAVAR